MFGHSLGVLTGPRLSLGWEQKASHKSCDIELSSPRWKSCPMREPADGAWVELGTELPGDSSWLCSSEWLLDP